MSIPRCFSFLMIAVILSVPHGNAASESAEDAIRKTGGRLVQSGIGWNLGFQHGGRDLTDDGLVRVAELGDSVVSLNLRDTKITSEGLKHLAGLTKLRRLHLERTVVDDEGMPHLSGLKDLEYLNLYGTKITDTALSSLAELKNLKKIFVWQTGVTDAGCAELRSALPDLKIFRGVDLDKVAAEAEKAKPKPEELVELKWIPAAGGGDPPRSKSGEFTSVTITNAKDYMVKLYWVEYGGGLRFYHDIAPGASLKRNTYSNATWVITDKDDTPLGYFLVPVKPSRITVPK